jgi:hypothetical protein
MAPAARFILDRRNRPGGLHRRVKRTYVRRPRGEPSKEYKERERSRDLLVASYVSSYDVSSNPSVVEGESMQSVKNNRRTLVEHW